MLVNEMLIFYHVVQYKNFSQTAEKLGVSKSFVSKQITHLETDLKTRLLNRSTRQVSLTEAGEVFFQHCKKLFELAQQGYDAMANLRQQPMGTMKISAPPALVLHLLTTPLIEYTKLYPEVKLNVVLESQIVDVIQQGFDIALRTTVLEDSNLIVQELTKLSNILCASPAYLKKHGLIKHPTQLPQHNFAVFSNQTSIKQYQFMYKKEKINVTVDGCIQSNNLDFIMQMVMSGCCMAVLPEFMVKSTIAKKKLVHCLPDHHLPRSPLYAFYPEREFKPLKLQLFIDLLKKYLQT
ncbi:MAG TPA: LysR family transcriptional regulator [Gammaproteobacteria bacterium]|nr:LysR family transcriptional regulator [Gammaproteobacteria bacterium]